MAGSYLHICDVDGSFSMELIENMGDAHEALEDCHSIIKDTLETLKMIGIVPCTDIQKSNCGACVCCLARGATNRVLHLNKGRLKDEGN